MSSLYDERRGLGHSPAGPEQAEKKEQDDCPDERHEDGPRYSGDGQADSQRAEEPPSDEGADDTDEDVADQAGADSANDRAGEQSGDEPHDDPGEDFQVISMSGDEPPAIAARPIRPTWHEVALTLGSKALCRGDSCDEFWARAA